MPSTARKILAAMVPQRRALSTSNVPEEYDSRMLYHFLSRSTTNTIQYMLNSLSGTFFHPFLPFLLYVVSSFTIG